MAERRKEIEQSETQIRKVNKKNTVKRCVKKLNT
ncbi:hypothetical protein MCERE19_02049 [Spirosomataceae bacterium]|jgi:hypothetical protein